MKNCRLSPTSGNALFFILIAIFLLGGLTVLLSRTGSHSEDTGASEQASIQASSILKYAAGVQNAVTNLLSNGCSEGQLNFNNPGITSGQNYVNTSSPPDHSCDIYHVAGGGLPYAPVPPAWLSTVTGFSKTWHVDASYCLNGIGTGGITTCTKAEIELLLIIDGVTLAVCNALNRQMGISSVAGAPPSDDIGINAFTGSFSTISSYAAATIGDTATPTAAPLIGKKSGCLMDTAGSSAGHYIFYHTLIAR